MSGCQPTIEVCSKHNVSFQNYCGFWKCPECNWEQVTPGCQPTNRCECICHSENKKFEEYKIGETVQYRCDHCFLKTLMNIATSTPIPYFPDTNQPVSPMVKQMQLLEERINKLEEHKNYPIDENRKVSKRVDELEGKNNKKPYKCPVCNCDGWILDSYLSDAKEIECHTCKGSGIIWG